MPIYDCFFFGLTLACHATEAALAPIALVLWPACFGGFGGPRSASHDPKNNDRRAQFRLAAAVGLAAVLFVLRPPASLLFLVPAARGMLLGSRRRVVLLVAAGCGLGVLLVNFGIDTWFYGQPVLPWWNFLVFNGLSNGASHFGVHPWFYYMGPEVLQTAHFNSRKT